MGEGEGEGEVDGASRWAVVVAPVGNAYVLYNSCWKRDFAFNRSEDAQLISILHHFS